MEKMVKTKAYRIKIGNLEYTLTTKKEVVRVLNGAPIDEKIEITVIYIMWEDDEFNSLEEEYRKELLSEIIFD
jgi:hypothetical protein